MKKIRYIFGLLVASIVLYSCVKQNYDNPPDTSQVDPNLTVNVHVSDLSNRILAAGAGSSYQFTGDSILSGIVTADDRSGNFYKQIVIQDSTGGIVIGIDRTNLYVDYPVGRKVYINLKGLVLVDYKGIPEIVFSVTNNSGSLSVSGIPSGLLTNTVVKASFPHTTQPLIIKFADIQSLGAAYCINRLVTFENMEFDSASANQIYALPSILSNGTSRTIHDCPLTSSITMYNSGYATFQPAITPSGKGTITGIYSVYNTTPQFLIRDTSDIHLTAPRDCIQ
jgi:hypothetical protein